MSGFDNLFDAAITRADGTIRTVMGVSVKVTSGALSGTEFTGVFDDPSETVYPGAGIRVEGSSPSVFVRTSVISLLQRADTLSINGVAYWVDRIGPDDCGSCYVWLGTGSPPMGTRRRQGDVWPSKG
ncbi:TPA: phage tail protein [Klebsiella pneumoniae]|uniref:head-tail joining protein n=1 Tax=Klebsiella pneumoniae TaxID=573 RepID=UPI0007CC810E|nr:head-tail joining protein [Klebsiella pneumoniae]MCF1380228.1 head-tail joining protein [Klebsiella pneumoniae]MCF2235224.1 head-tail joining protein [Klebsiella pneumoniae]MDV5335285.1 head-tail joining protein [Klebsiella pneumoniae]MDV5340656.1 head-tail joining protein [Klebsiella pneumoniae]MDV5361479.1 head-tail joining protein [Klebsiella pneumoniae]